MTQNPKPSPDVFEFLDDIIPDTPETKLVERQELFRIALTQAMRNLRKKLGVTQKEVAQRLGITQSWVSKLESANNDHTFESVLAYLNALSADFEASIVLEGKTVAKIAAHLNATEAEIKTAIETVLDTPEKPEIEGVVNTNPPNFDLLLPEQKEKCNQAQKQIQKMNGLWGTAA
jgi:transcriptional regulator with XRE-family HTH domain